MTATLSSHILDTHLGTPAANIKVSLSKCINHDNTGNSKSIQLLATAETNDDGRIAINDWNGVEGFDVSTDLTEGRYNLAFDTQSYFEHQELTVFYPEVIVNFIVGDDSHYHIPLLLSAHGYSTYRGS